MNNQEHVHSRNISVNCFHINDETMYVEGYLKDERFHPSDVRISDENRKKDTIHHMCVKMNVSLPRLIILSLSVELLKIPNEACSGAGNSLNKIIGLQIKHGFTDAVRNLLGNSEGCAHIMNLILAMGSAAVQGAWSSLSTRTSHGKMPDIDESIMINSCWLWREDGPLATQIKENQSTRS